MLKSTKNWGGKWYKPFVAGGDQPTDAGGNGLRKETS
jgi:hypothetical protein